MFGLMPTPRFLRFFDPRFRQHLEQDIADELQFHLDMRALDNQAAGMTPEEALADARRRFGDVARIRAACVQIQEQHPLALVLDYARTVLLLAIGVGMLTVVFLVLNAVLFRLPLTFHDDQPWVAVWWEHTDGGLTANSTLSDFQAMQDQDEIFDRVTLAQYRSYYLSGDGQPAQVMGKLVSNDYFSLHGSRPRYGRVFTAAESTGEANPVVLSYGFWERHFKGNINALGQKITLDDRPYTVVGVMPDDFQMYYETDVFLPLRFEAVPDKQERRFLVAGRLKPAVTMLQAETHLEALVQPFRQQYPVVYAGWKVKVRSVQEVYAAPVQHHLFLYLGMTGLVLLIVAVHVFRKQLGRLLARQEAPSVAGDGPRLLEGLVESVLLTVAGGLLGLVLALGVVDILLQPMLGSLAHVFDVRLDGRVLGFVLSISLVLGLGMGLAPLFFRERPDWRWLESTRRPASPDKRQQWFGSVLTMTEVALALILLVIAGLMGRGMLDMQRGSMGFNPDSLFTVSINLPTTQYVSVRDKAVFFGEMFKRVETLDGVKAASLVQAFPVRDDMPYTALHVVGEVPEAPWHTAHYNIVGRDYFDVMEIALRRGRLFTREDYTSATGSIVINETMAAHLWPGQDPIGQKVTMPGRRAHPVEVIGVVADVWQRLDVKPEPTFYVLYWRAVGGSTNLVVRADTDPRALAALVQKTIWSINPKVPLENLTMAQAMIAGYQRRSFLLVGGMTILALLGLMLAMASIYRSIVQSVQAQMQEIGIRMVLGATPHDIRTLALRTILGAVGAGMALGLTGAFFCARLIPDHFFGVSPLDPLTYGFVSLVLITAVLAAGYLPARKATQIDPLLALRYG